MAAPVRSDGPIAARYLKFSIARAEYIERGRDCAALTIPSLFPRETTKGAKIITPYSGFGARGVNNLGAKLMMALFPSNLPFFRLVVDEFALEELGAAKGDAEKALSKIERSVATDVETTFIRVPLFEALKHLIVVGNVLFYRDPKTGRGRAIPLTSYIVRRDPMGNVLEIIVREEIANVLLPTAALALLAGKEGGDDDTEEMVPIFTRILREKNRWAVTQEAAGVAIESAAGGYPLDQCPWLPLRMILVDGEDYGRSFVEEHYGDLNSNEKLTKAIIQFSAAAAKIVFLVKPNSTTKPAALAKANSGDFVTGSEADIAALGIDKFADFQVASATSERIETRLGYVFLLNSAIQRNGDRVTAEEIRRVAQELDTGLGGVHALLAQELQLPLVSNIMATKAKKRELPALPKGLVKPVVVTGIEALGRGTDLDNLMTAINALATVPNALQRIKGGEFGKRVFAAVQQSSDGLFMTDEEVAQEQQAAAAAQMAQAATPAVAKAAAEGTMEPPA